MQLPPSRHVYALDHRGFRIASLSTSEIPEWEGASADFLRRKAWRAFGERFRWNDRRAKAFSYQVIDP